jgi:hypothetical protein
MDSESSERIEVSPVEKRAQWEAMEFRVKAASASDAEMREARQ